MCSVLVFCRMTVSVLHLLQFVVIHSTGGVTSCVTHLRVTADLDPVTLLVLRDRDLGELDQ